MKRPPATPEGLVVDLDPEANSEDNASLLVRHLLASDGEDQVALRSGQRFVPRIAPYNPAARTSPFAWRRDATYLVTGGLGGVGLHVVRKMAELGARRFVLLSRTPLPPRERWNSVDAFGVVGERIAAVKALEAAGVSVHIATVDVANESQLRAFLQQYVEQAWPPIRGVIHAVGGFENALTGVMDRHAFDAVLGPKLLGAEALDRLLPDLDLFVVFSSTGAFLAQPGQANYAAANAGLDALVQDRRARGLPGLSVAWGVWANTGLVKSAAGERNVAGWLLACDRATPDQAKENLHSPI